MSADPRAGGLSVAREREPVRLAERGREVVEDSITFAGLSALQFIYLLRGEFIYE